ncbi:hypothetical protein DW322_11215 [Rhodococcus rhodnii]|uniref:HNH domain-containing protein n=1 Tax=Rhodococcus rhodnii TaxID=38312 RepID=A0A6P2CG24_9NOCA|nr:hypothetical protein DW322_11215 [Rhodococcus rhodnii]
MPRARNRVCSTPGCPRMQPETQCLEHRRDENRHRHATTPTKSTRDWAERQRRATAVNAHRARHGGWCPGYGVPAHHATDLTADHIVPVARGGDPRGPLTVLCRSCNGRKAHN